MSVEFNPTIPNTTLAQNLDSMLQINPNSITNFSTPVNYPTTNQTLQQGYENTLMNRIIASQIQTNPASITNFSTPTSYYPISDFTPSPPSLGSSSSNSIILWIIGIGAGIILLAALMQKR